MEYKPLVSIIMPVYNTEKYLDECIASVVKQTFKDLEIICVDDGSTDNSLEILKKYAIADKRIKIIEQNNCGAGKARNIGMSIANGEYLLFLDADDFFELDYIEKAYNHIINSQAEICLVRCNAYNEITKKYSNMQWTIKDEWLDNSKNIFNKDNINNGGIFNFVVGWTWDKLFKAEFVRKNGILFQEQRTTNDAFFVFILMSLAEKICYIDEILVHYRRNVKTSLSATREKSYKCFYDAIIAINDELINKNIYQSTENSFKQWIVSFSISTLWAVKGKARVGVYYLIKDLIHKFNLLKLKKIFGDRNKINMIKDINGLEYDDFILKCNDKFIQKNNYMVHNEINEKIIEKYKKEIEALKSKIDILKGTIKILMN